MSVEYTTGRETVVLPKLTSVGDLIFASIRKEKRVTDLHLASLKLLFDKHAHKAVAIVDSERVSCLVDEHSGRKVYRVKGQRSGETYTVLPEHFCSCHSHFYDIVTKSEGVYCKHQIAIFLSDALGRTRVKKVQGLVIAEILQDIH